MDEQKRLLLALALMAVLVIIWTTFISPMLDPAPPARPQQQAQTGGGDAGPEDDEEDAADAGPDAAAAEAEPTKVTERPARELHPEKRVTLRTPQLVVEISTHGGGLTKAELLDEQFREGRGDEMRQIDLISIDVDEHPELVPVAFNLVQKQLSRPSSGETAEGQGVLKMLRNRDLNAEMLEAAGVNKQIASRLTASGPFATMEELEEEIGGSAARKRRVLGKLLAAAWRTGFVRLDFEVVSEADDRVVLRGRTDNDVEVVRAISIASDFEFRIEDRLRNHSSRGLHLRERLLTSGLEKQVSSSGWFQRPQGQMAGLCLAGDEMTRSTRSLLAGESSGCMGCGGDPGPASRNGAIRFVAVDRHFFMTAVSPSPAWGESTCALSGAGQRLFAAVEPVMFTEVPAGESTTYASTTYLGPKRYSVLRELGPGRQLWEAIDYGWFAPLSHILLRALRIFYGWFGNWGLAVIFLTFVIKLILLPVTHKSLKSMRQMQAEMAVLKPQMDEINERYKDRPDVKQQKVMELYKENGINPLKQMTGCLPMFLQMPIWIALYRMISESVELYRAPFYFWLDDLSAQDPYYILPALLGVSMFLQQLVTPTPGVDNAQAKMMKWMMPAMFLFIMLNMPSGLVLYIFANTLLTIVQQQIINRMIPAPVPGKAKDSESPKGSDNATLPKADKKRSSRKTKSKRRKRK